MIPNLLRTRPVLAAALLAVAAPALAADKVFPKPRYSYPQKGIPLLPVDYCWRHQQQCGFRAADLYCKMQGYKTAAGFVKLENVGQSISIGDRKICDVGKCDGFSSITCTGG